MPEPAGEEGNVHALRAHDAKASLLPGLADVGPNNHMIFLLVIVPDPIEAALDFGDIVMEGLVKAVEAHKEQEEAGERGVDENRPGRL